MSRGGGLCRKRGGSLGVWAVFNVQNRGDGLDGASSCLLHININKKKKVLVVFYLKCDILKV